MISNECAAYLEKQYPPESEYELSRDEYLSGNLRIDARKRFRDFTNDQIKEIIRKYKIRSLMELLTGAEIVAEQHHFLSEDVKARIWGYEDGKHYGSACSRLHDLTLRMTDKRVTKDELFF